MKKSLFLLFFLSLSTLVADDVYRLTFSKETGKCTLEKNGKETALFDTRFESKPPKSAYKCYAIQKEQYKDCKVIAKKNVTAMFMGYGTYDYTNAILAFQNINRHYDSVLAVKCSKKSVYDYGE